MTTDRLAYLFDRYFTNTCSEEEKQELAVIILSQKHDVRIQNLLETAWDTISTEEVMQTEKASEIMDSILSQAPVYKQENGIKDSKLINMFSFRRIAVAASILLVLASGAYLLTGKKATHPEEIAKTIQVEQDVVAPESSKATIKLANGKKILLDSALNQTLDQGDVRVNIKEGGQIVYTGGKDAVEMFNVLENPRGSKVINLTLADGTKVWLNSESSLTYPVTYVGNERKVEVTGEAYFEVAHNASKPFIVTNVAKNVEIKVLGTHFNVNSYKDEKVMKTTLLEGSVRVSLGGKSVVIKPGEQAEIGVGSGMTVQKVNVEEVVAWKNGRFIFNSASIESIMRQAARWYDVTVIFENKSNETFSGRLPREANLSELLKMLAATGSVEFNINGKEIIVKQK